jgi:hypothetical protein
MPWAASQVAWAGPGVLDFLVVPASRRRREAGRHRGLRGPKAIADQVVYEWFPGGRPATGGRAAAGASWAAAAGAGLAKATVRLAFIWPASAGEYGGGQPISTVRRCRKDHPAARCVTAFCHCR